MAPLGFEKDLPFRFTLDAFSGALAVGPWLFCESVATMKGVSCSRHHEMLLLALSFPEFWSHFGLLIVLGEALTKFEMRRDEGQKWILPVSQAVKAATIGLSVPRLGGEPLPTDLGPFCQCEASSHCLGTY